MLKNVKNIISDATEVSKIGFRGFLKLVLLVILLGIGARAITEPKLILQPVQYINSLTANSVLYCFVLFVIIILIYIVARSLSMDYKKHEITEFTKQVDNINANLVEQKEKEHTERLLKRLEIGPKIRFELKDLLIKLGATRACICEMHNGTNSIAGLPFLYMDVSYEEISPKKVNFISEEFKNFNMSKYPFIINHIYDLYWVGSIEDLKKEDLFLGSKVNMFDDSLYGAVMTLRGTDSLIGMLVVTFNSLDNLPDNEDIIKAMASASQIVSTLLDKTVLDDSVLRIKH